MWPCSASLDGDSDSRSMLSIDVPSQEVLVFIVVCGRVNSVWCDNFSFRDGCDCADLSIVPTLLVIVVMMVMERRSMCVP